MDGGGPASGVTAHPASGEGLNLIVVTRELATAVARGVVLAVVLSLLWHFAAPVTPFDPFTADLGDASASSTSIVGYAYVVVTLGPAWLPSSMVIAGVCVASFVGLALLTRSAGRHRGVSPTTRGVAARWWPTAASVVIGLSVAVVAAISAPQSRGFALVDPSSLQARMEDSVLFRDSVAVFTVLCVALSLLVGIVFLASPKGKRHGRTETT